MVGQEVLFTDGDWRVQKFTYPGWRGVGEDSYIYVAHYCTAGRSGYPIKGWVGMHYCYNSMRAPCYVCERVPPAGLQGLFATLTTL